ncbi:uncharacterized protein [Notamacropus eugenii]|uniref:uncharacterized protein n=1 Tax=Notamacropus eugenii TaxID=9315 RepID=UPI003B6810EF
MPGLKRYEVALEAEEEIYWGCFYFFPWLRMWRREKSTPTEAEAGTPSPSGELPVQELGPPPLQAKQSPLSGSAAPRDPASITLSGRGSAAPQQCRGVKDLTWILTLPASLCRCRCRCWVGGGKRKGTTMCKDWVWCLRFPDPKGKAVGLGESLPFFLHSFTPSSCSSPPSPPNQGGGGSSKNASSSHTLDTGNSTPPPNLFHLKGLALRSVFIQRFPTQPKLLRSSMKGMEITLILTLLVLNFSPRRALLVDPSISCCTQVYRKTIPCKFFRNVIQLEIQEANGDCHIQAYVLYRKNGRPVCVHPENPSLIRWLSWKQKNHDLRCRLN